jgi:formate/nitrite transporter FocA (FNT family)
MGLLITDFPALRRTAIEAGQHYVNLGVGGQAFALAMLGGMVITLMTWMHHHVESCAAKVVAVLTAAFLLVGGGLDHAVVNSLLIFAGLHTGHAGHGYLAWAQKRRLRGLRQHRRRGGPSRRASGCCRCPTG